MTRYARPKTLSRAPTHPGAVLKEGVIPALDTTVTQAAKTWASAA